MQVAQAAETKEQMSRQGLEARAAGSAELAKLLNMEIQNYKTVFKSAGIKMQ
jgi:tripartite-type tricarboxylate transporter receptor subunit TctC